MRQDSYSEEGSSAVTEHILRAQITTSRGDCGHPEDVNGYDYISPSESHVLCLPTVGSSNAWFISHNAYPSVPYCKAGRVAGIFPSSSNRCLLGNV